jgi:hypothetical protein
MTEKPHQDEWRGLATMVASELDDAHSAVQVLGRALEEGETRVARRRYSAARDAVGSVTRDVTRLSLEQPLREDMDEHTAVGSELALRGSGAASVALEVMVNAMAALATTDDQDDVDLLTEVCADAERAFEVSAAVVKAAPRSRGSSILDLKRAFETEGVVMLRRKVNASRARVFEINERIGNRLFPSVDDRRAAT